MLNDEGGKINSLSGFVLRKGTKLNLNGVCFKFMVTDSMHTCSSLE